MSKIYLLEGFFHLLQFSKGKVAKYGQTNHYHQGVIDLGNCEGKILLVTINNTGPESGIFQYILQFHPQGS